MPGLKWRIFFLTVRVDCCKSREICFLENPLLYKSRIAALNIYIKRGFSRGLSGFLVSCIVRIIQSEI